MSSDLDGVGLRLLSVRKRLGFTQSVMAAKLDIADRSYTYYEQEKRELPSSVAVRFSRLFEVELDWLLTGSEGTVSKSEQALISACIRAVWQEAGRLEKAYSVEKLAQVSAFVFEQCSSKRSDPVDEAISIFKMMD